MRRTTWLTSITSKRIVVSFGIRRGGEKDKGHDHVPQAIHLGPHKARLLGQCPMTQEQWIPEMIGKGVIEPPS